ncbi:MAG: hypothetical protein H6722_15385 [Sandaracinus sp.]|nr:hypothetical protein [Myxococcales bacterium]MCB9613825.1 hypothetical protein [Sandaracinus sp.]
MRIRLVTDRGVLFATLADNATSRDFAALLPLLLPVHDYAQTEKVCDLPGRLSTKGAPSGFAARAGALTYYAPWGNLAIFYRDFRRADGLVELGLLDLGANGEALASLRAMEDGTLVRFELDVDVPGRGV